MASRLFGSVCAQLILVFKVTLLEHAVPVVHAQKIQTIFSLFILAFTDAFESGTERAFSIINDVTLYDLKTSDQPIGYRISGAVKVGAIWGDDEVGFLIRYEVQYR